jgi:hypothetical protein
MKKIIYLLSVTFLLLHSCSSGDSPSAADNSSQGYLIKKIVSDNGSVENYSYDGNKLLRISYEDGTGIVLTYTGDLITKAELNDSNNNFTGEYQTMSYLNGRIVQKNFYNNNILFSKYDYTYNIDGTRTKTTTNYKVLNFSNAGTSVSKEYFDAGGNIIKDVMGTYSYDSKNNPHKNITGWIIAEGSGTEKINNLLMETSGAIYTYNYEYNDQGYPISLIMTTGTSRYSEQYFY